MADSILKVNSEGKIITCAKGDVSACGYVPGAKVCAKCGALAISVKNKPTMMVEDDEMMEEYGDDAKGYGGMAPDPEMMRRRAKAPMSAEDDEMEDDEEVDLTPRLRDPRITGNVTVDPSTADDEEMPEEMPEEDEDTAPAKGGMMRGLPMDDEEDMVPAKGGMMRMREMPMADDDEDDEDDPDEIDDLADQLEEMVATARSAARKRRLQSMGMKSAEFGEDDYVCGIDRKMHDAGSHPCAFCPGGCAPEAGLPTLLEIEGIAEDLFDGKVLDSGYADQADIFIVDLVRKDGKPVEAFFTGDSGECIRWQLLNENVISEKTAVQGIDIISFEEARDIALDNIEGKALVIDADVLDGNDVYVVEIDGVNGKSYDVYVGLDGEYLGHDEYTAEEAAGIEEEAAELALKRMYSEESRSQMAESGAALPDGSFPIKDHADLQNAIQAYGRAKDKPAAKRHIMKRARDLGMEDMIPENWGVMGEKADELVASLMEFELLMTEEDLRDIL